MKRLLDVLRDECGLTGTKEGCGEGECGACTVLVDGLPVNSCLVPAVQAQGARIVTVEGLARGPKLTALQQAFVELGGAQCGICTPGMLLSSVALLSRAKGRVPRETEIREALAGNLCRCTGYQKIVDAVRAAARKGKAKSPLKVSANRALAAGGARQGSSRRRREESSPKKAAAAREGSRGSSSTRRALAAGGVRQGFSGRSREKSLPKKAAAARERTRR
ncbi:MAG: (2Fe-2S)-binding protein [Candidatus Eisenbacteria bacterium]|nr:(2Fe-2S)-binding protein [Candidatus Eisenbacteria bacterium]